MMTDTGYRIPDAGQGGSSKWPQKALSYSRQLAA